MVAGLYRVADRSRLLTAAGKDALDLGSLAVKGRPHEMEASKVIPAGAEPQNAVFGEVARLVASAGLSPVLDPAEPTRLTLYWQARGATQAPYTVFVHLVDEETNAVIGYGDAEPGSGAYPTTGWVQGEHLADAHTVTFAAEQARGRPVRIEIGLYDPATGQRQILPDGADSFVLWRGRFGG